MHFVSCSYIKQIVTVTGFADILSCLQIVKNGGDSLSQNKSTQNPALVEVAQLNFLQFPCTFVAGKSTIPYIHLFPILI